MQVFSVCSQIATEVDKETGNTTVARLEQTLRLRQADLLTFKSALREISCRDAHSSSLANLANEVEHLRGREALSKELQLKAERGRAFAVAESDRLAKEKARIEMQLTSARSEIK